MIVKNSMDEELKINCHSSFEKFTSYSLIEFFTASENDPIFREKFKNKIILIGVTDPTIGKSISTPFDDLLAGIGLHAFAVDNLLTHRGLNNTYYNYSLILFFVLLVIILFIIKNNRIFYYFGIATVLVFLSHMLFIILFIELHYTLLLFH